MKAMLGCLTAVAAVMATGAQAIEITLPVIQIPVIPVPTIPTIPVPVIPTPVNNQAGSATKTPIKHLVVIFPENRSFDHYFATYPVAQNNTGEVTFTAAANTPMVNNLANPLNVNAGFSVLSPNPGLLTNNPNGPMGSGAATNGTNATNPFRLAPVNAWSEGNNHSYTPEQNAYDNGNMDLFPAKVSGSDEWGNGCVSGQTASGNDCFISSSKGLTMAFFDGNTVTGLWNMAQNFAMSDNAFTSMFGPSTPGAVNMISGQTNFITEATPSVAGTGFPPDGHGNFTINGDIDPFGDVCSSKNSNAGLGGINIGDLLNTKGITWGWFSGGFNLGLTNANGSTGCGRSRLMAAAPGRGAQGDYVQHHQPFQFFASTANPTHARPTSVATIGMTDAANHQYDTQDFFAAVAAGNLPAVSFLKAPSAQDSHPGNSDPQDEQVFLANVLNALEQTADWSSTAIIYTFDDSDGWYDHQMPPIVNISQDVGVDTINGAVTTTNGVTTGGCVSSNQQQNQPTGGQLDGVQGAPVQARCGYGTRIPFLVISPWAKKNFVDHTLLDQSSVSRFIEDNWLDGQRLGDGSFDQIAGSVENMFNFNQVIITPRKVFLNPENGAIVATPPANSTAAAVGPTE